MSLFFNNIVRSRRLVLFVLLCFSFNATVSAAMVSTIQSVNSTKSQLANTVVLELGVSRNILKQQLIAFGVAPEQINSRLNSMTDGEIAALSSEISELPAGGDILGVLAVVFLVLLFTDIAGYTDLFPFVKKTSKNSSSTSNGSTNSRQNSSNRKEPVIVEN